MSLLVTGASGYLGSYVCERLLHEHGAPLTLVVRARDRRQAEEKLWKAWQLHMDPERFFDAMSRINVVLGDITAPQLGLDDATYADVVRDTESVLHAAAALNRMSERACLNTNLRGTLSVIKLARDAAAHHGLRRFSFLSAIAVAGERRDELVREDEAIDWERRDYDPYARTKKFGEHMVRELLPDVPLTIFRPPTVMGDSRFPHTTQFDMVRATCVLADMPVVPVRRDARMDIVNADFVGRAIASLHCAGSTAHDTYHLTAGASSRTTGEIAEAIFAPGSGNRGRAPRFAPALEGAFAATCDRVAHSNRRNTATYIASLLRVFLPYIANNTVYDNTRVTRETGLSPVPFTEYCASVYSWAKQVGFQYPYRALPERAGRRTVQSPAAQPEEVG